VAEYHYRTHAEVRDWEALIRELSALEGLTFSHYDGVVHATPSFLQWYTARPGLKRGLCQAAFAGNKLVCNVFVTLARMRLGGGPVICGLVDTVMTHPDHRRRGLATALLERALRAMESEGADLSLLYTARAEAVLPPERLYQRLGYAPRELVTRLLRPARPAEGSPSVLMPPDASARQVFDQSLSRHDGWLLLDDDLWRWRRQQRPREYPVALLGTASGGAAALCTGELIMSGAPLPVSVISDLVLPAGAAARGALDALLACAPAEAAITVLCPQSEVQRERLLLEAGFAPSGVEVAMLRPISERGRAALRAPAAPWYVAVESVIGV